MSDFPARPAEWEHSIKCLSTALIRAIENTRDLEYISAFEFGYSSQHNDFHYLALGYLVSGTIECLCPDN